MWVVLFVVSPFVDYIRYAKDGLSSNFGDFYTMIVAAVWVYYLLSSFYGASGYMNKPQIIERVHRFQVPLKYLKRTFCLSLPMN